mmetsp:Transcript_58434/g.161690  ORF Transcript_58434/g.161690 Transcript_58434/m.161690 type:complete len:159 (-) Transcript_58434:79-555(-)|eukprot:CAMPEP_0179085600 /NCGR_PEP_ID=MMETSP0796-20121207/38778_1 /TAXON_ID=73915 /ORGANISM="Pyrodinium bahamense, Strain pbaha01" /LENGTH=158 /DNA_ID=CAMNT_0020783045 /DNA_START=65 /DNA_END=541 /DNA_ORIENTATION=-
MCSAGPDRAPVRRDGLCIAAFRHGFRHRRATARGAWLLHVLLVASLAGLACAKPKKYGHSTAKVHWKRENECAKTDCKEFHPDENDDCLAKCVSQPCYAEVYGEDPLEPGEVDRTRSIKFNACVRKEYDDEKARKAEERRKEAEEKRKEAEEKRKAKR